MENLKNIEIAENIFWVGVYKKEIKLNSNVYLIIDDEDAILIDPGSPIIFNYIYNNLLELIPIEKISYVILHHQDPDISASIPRFEQRGLNAKIIIHQNSKLIIDHYGFASEFYIISEEQNKLVLKSGREIFFLPTPYLHSYGAIVTYDSKSKILFSSDLFSATPYRWKLFADRVFYKEAMKTLHERLMPSSKILRTVMDWFLTFDISMISPQHGSIIKRELVKRYIEYLRNAYCGVLLDPIKYELFQKQGIVGYCNEVLQKYFTLFNRNEIVEIFDNTEIEIKEANNTLYINKFKCDYTDLWDMFFKIFYNKKGYKWIDIEIIKNFVSSIQNKHSIPKPKVFEEAKQDRDRDTDSYKTELNKKSNELEKSEKIRQELDLQIEKLVEAEEQRIKCRITNLNNEVKFREIIKDIFTNYPNNKHIQDQNNKLFSVLLIDIDKLSDIKRKYGEKATAEIKDILKTITDILINKRDEKNAGHKIFKLYKDSEFLYYIPNPTEEQSREIAEEIRIAIRDDSSFRNKTTVSIGFIIWPDFDNFLENTEEILDISREGIKKAKKTGGDSIFDASKEQKTTTISILVADYDKLYCDFLKNRLQQLGTTFKLEQKSIDYLKEDNVKTEICEKLKLLLNKNFTQEQEFLQKVRHYIGDKQTQLYKEQILKHAQSNYKIFICSDGDKAVNIIETEKPHLVISELMLPKQNGLEVRENMRNLTSEKNTPFILISHLKDEATTQLAYELDIDYYLKRPFYISELLGIVEKIVYRV
jgi:PleD family two-component response regulator